MQRRETGGFEPPGDEPPAGAVLLIDFGSTYTKLVAVDLDEGRIVGQTQSLTTAETDITLGLRKGLRQLEEAGLPAAVFRHRLACSSARGGLTMIAIGLVPKLTLEAARRAALGAGARILRSYAHKLSPAELEEIVGLKPDMILLAGGTDGGDYGVIVYNAHLLGHTNLSAPIVVAGNKDAIPLVQEAFGGREEVYFTENVLPSLGQLNVEPARACIRQLFMEKIVEAKGMRNAEQFVHHVLMPTPMAVLRAARLLAEGTGRERGLGELMVIDVGGATTDVHSVAGGEPTQKTVVMRGLPEPYAKRTVEGDLGLRVSAVSLLAAVGEERLSEFIGLPDLNLPAIARRLATPLAAVPAAARDIAIDLGMTKAAVRLSVERHVGTLREHFLPEGFCYIQEGKDLTRLPTLIGTGGPFHYLKERRQALEEALYRPQDPFLLRPKNPRLYVDRRYILWAMGLLADIVPGVALRMMKENLEEV
ncbi:MAG: MutL protein [Chloroflexi bacterium]|nr:MutL protein [Chloroflexota bacterium]